MATFKSKFEHGDHVWTDGDKSLKGVVVGHCFYTDRCEVQVSWVCNGDLKTNWIAEWRLLEATE
jgi:hypothetical protein